MQSSSWLGFIHVLTDVLIPTKKKKTKEYEEVLFLKELKSLAER